MDTNGTSFKNRKLKLNSASILTILCIVLVLIVAATGFYEPNGQLLRASVNTIKPLNRDYNLKFRSA